jgi:hypothetical protein
MVALPSFSRRNSLAMKESVSSPAAILSWTVCDMCLSSASPRSLVRLAALRDGMIHSVM